MKAIILYATKYGATREVAERIAAKLTGGAELMEIQKNMRLDFTPYDTVVVGCSVYMGKPRKEAKAFCEEHFDALLTRNLGLFLCCIQDLDKTVAKQFGLAFPKRLREHATVLGILGGKVNYAKLQRFDGFIMNLIAGDLRKKTGQDVVSTISEERIDRFVELLQHKK